MQKNLCARTGKHIRNLFHECSVKKCTAIVAAAITASIPLLKVNYLCMIITTHQHYVA